MDYKQKYLKYKTKYLELKNIYGGNRCPFEVGDYVIITGPVGDPHLGQNGNITHLHFVNKNINGQDVRICTGAIINLQGGIRKKSLTTDIRLYKHILPSDTPCEIFKNLSLEELLRRYNHIEALEQRDLENCPFDFYDQPIPVGLTLAQFRNIFRAAYGINLSNHRTITNNDFMTSIRPTATSKRLRINMLRCTEITDAAFVHLAGIQTLDMTACNQPTITDAAFSHLRGIQTLNMGYCYQHTITDAAFAHLRGIQTLNISYCNQDTITDAAFAHLRGIHTLNMELCDQDTITDAAFAHLRGIQTLNMKMCSQLTITDAAFAHLRGIQTLNMVNCNQPTITDAAFAHLRGIQTLNMGSCSQPTITDAAFAHLRGIQTLYMEGCTQITPVGIAHLVGIKKLSMYGCNPATIAAARALGLPVFA